MKNSPQDGPGYPGKDYRSNTWGYNVAVSTASEDLPTPVSDVFVAKMFIRSRSDNVGQLIITPKSQDTLAGMGVSWAGNNYIVLLPGDEVELYGKPSDYTAVSSVGTVNIEFVYHLG